MSTETLKQEGLFYSVIDGTFRRRVADDTPGAVKRDYETSDGTKATKYEMVVDSLEGYVKDIGIFDGDFGRNLQIKLDPNAKGISPQIQFSIETTYGEDVLKKLPRVDFKKPVKFRPFAFTDQTSGREIRGVEVSQDGEKFKNFFWDAEAKAPINGLPAIEGDTSGYTKDDWKIHFLNVRKFLVGFFNDTIRPRFEQEVQQQTTGAPVSKEISQMDGEEEINPDDIPF